MSLTGLPLLLLLVAIALALCTGIYLGWTRWPKRLALPLRLISLLVVMVLGALLAGDAVNRSFNFYSSFGDLLGGPPSARSFAVLDGPKPQATVDVLEPRWLDRAIPNAKNGRGTLLRVTFPGVRSGITRTGELYLPAAYFLNKSGPYFAAVEIFPGYPGHPIDYERQLSISRQLDTEIAAGRIPPLVAVIPSTYDHLSTECVDGIDGERDATYLTQDVFDDVVNTFRVQSGRTWGALGISTGGFCAANLALHHPERFAAAASLSGYFNAGSDPHTGRLYGGHGKYARSVNSPLWWVTHRAPVAPPLYICASAGDPSAVQSATAMVAALNKHAKSLPMQYALLASGGHNWGVWSVAFAPALDWIAQYLPAPLQPAKVLPAGPV